MVWSKRQILFSLMYLSNIYKECDLFNIKKDKECLVIQVGNSADPTNNHVEILMKLKKYKNENIEII